MSLNFDIYENTNPVELKKLLQQIHDREMALPDFQRDFVWEPQATRELIVSIARNHPAGSLLRIRNTRNDFACREFEGAPALHRPAPSFLVLDGQQRLTSLYQAFYGVGEHRYYIDLIKLMETDDADEAIFYVSAESKKAQLLEDFQYQAENLVLPLHALNRGVGDYTKWMWEVTEFLNPVLSLPEQTALRETLMEFGKSWVQTFDDYRFPVVTLVGETPVEAVCTIFETLNRTGVKLSPFELLTARFWPQGVNLRDLWEDALAKHQVIADFDIDPYYIMIILALIARTTPSANRADVMTLTARDIKTWWAPAVTGLSSALEILQHDCGVLGPKWLPYNTIIMPFAAVLAKNHKLTGPATGKQRKQLVHWYWCCVFGQRYDASATSAMAKDVADLLAWFKNDRAVPEAIAEFSFHPEVLRDTTTRQRALYRGVMNLLVAGKTKDFHTLKPITPAIAEKEGIDDHHIFPQAYLKKNGGAAAKHKDSILNRTLIGRTTNLRIGRRAPSNYLADMRSEMGPTLDQLLESHMLPTGKISPLAKDQFPSFLAWRQEAIGQRIRELTSHPANADNDPGDR